MQLTKENTAIKEAYNKLRNEPKLNQSVINDRQPSISPEFISKMSHGQVFYKNLEKNIDSSRGPITSERNNGYQLDHKVESLNARTASSIKNRDNELIINPTNMRASLSTNKFNQKLFNNNISNNNSNNNFTTPLSKNRGIIYQNQDKENINMNNMRLNPNNHNNNNNLNNNNSFQNINNNVILQRKNQIQNDNQMRMSTYNNPDDRKKFKFN